MSKVLTSIYYVLDMLSGGLYMFYLSSHWEVSVRSPHRLSILHLNRHNRESLWGVRPLKISNYSLKASPIIKPSPVDKHPPLTHLCCHRIRVFAGQSWVANGVQKREICTPEMKGGSWENRWKDSKAKDVIIKLLKPVMNQWIF